MGFISQLRISSQADAITSVSRAVDHLIGGLPKPKSLCELRIDNADYQWLCQWASTLTSDVACSCLTGVASDSSRSGPRCYSREAFGLVFLLVASEVARREAPSHDLWPTVIDHFSRESQAVLFSGLHPRASLKEAIEAAVKRWGLRHALGTEGVQRYYLTVQLQFGWTRKSLARLAYWLEEFQCPEAIQWLRQSDQQSASFRLLWNKLRQFHDGVVGEDELRGALTNTPWVLPEWASDILTLARRPVGIITSAADDHEQLYTFDTPCLRWAPPRKPQFVLNMANPEALGLTDPTYSLVLGGSVVCRLIRQPNGSYRLTGEVVLPTDRSVCTLQVIKESGDVLSELPIQLWDNQEDINLYELPSGDPVDPWLTPMLPHQSYALAIAGDLSISPRPAEWFRAANGGRVVYFMPANEWSSETEVSLEGQLIWRPMLAAKAPREIEPEWVRRVGVRSIVEATSNGPLAVLEFNGLAAGTIVRRLRAGGGAHTWSRTSDHRFELPLDPELAGRDLRLSALLTRGAERATIVRRIRFDLDGMAVLADRGWRWVQPTEALDLYEMQRMSVRVYNSKREGEMKKRCALWEGEAFVGWVSERQTCFSRLGGYGAPLLLRTDRFNSMEPPLKCAASVNNTGILAHVAVDDGNIRMSLRSIVEPGPDHAVVLWEPTAEPKMVKHVEIRQDGACWVVKGKLPANSAAVAIAFRGRRIGGWWGVDMPIAVGRVVLSESKLCRAAALIRWFHVPVLHEEWFSHMEAFAHKHAKEALSAWVLGSGLPAGLSQEPECETWFAAVRALLSNWIPAAQDVEEVIEVLADSDSEHGPIVSAVLALTAVDPWLMARVIATLCPLTPSIRRQVQVALRLLLGLRSDADGSAIIKEMDKGLTKAAMALNVDPQYMNSQIIKPVRLRNPGETIPRALMTNLFCSLTSGTFREYLGACLLYDLLAKEGC